MDVCLSFWGSSKTSVYRLSVGSSFIDVRDFADLY